MARYEHLPICKAALDVAVGFEKLVAGFPALSQIQTGHGTAQRQSPCGGAGDVRQRSVRW